MKPIRTFAALLPLLAIAAGPPAPTAGAPAMTQPATPPSVSGEDPLFREPYIDIDEWRDAPVRHHYIHGGFKGTETRFSFYFPPADKYQGRFFQYVTPVPDNENLAQKPDRDDDKIGFSIASGGYFVETNGGGTSQTAGPAFGADPTIAAFRANAAAAQFSRVQALKLYGGKRPYGYLYGGSGGGYRTLGSMENTQGVWDGAVPFVLGSPMAAPNVFAVRMHAMRLLDGHFPAIVDAMDAGGSGDPAAGLNDEQREAWREVTAMGFPPRSWFGYKTMGVHAFTALYQGMVMADPTYFTDFWTKPGYLGFDPPESLKVARLQFETTIAAPLDEDKAVARGLPEVRIPGTDRGSADAAWRTALDDGSKRPVAFDLGGTPPDVGFLGGDLVIESGAAAGKRLAVRLLRGSTVTLGVVDTKVLALVRPGDKVRLDNSNFLAAQTYHRHQVPGRDYAVWDQFRAPDGAPKYPQRKINLGPLFTRGAAGTVPTGAFNGKIIVVESLLDREAFPWQADWYAHKFDAHFGASAHDHYRLWYTDNALHGASEDKDEPTRVISYIGVLQQALRDVSAWVEKGTPPPETTSYRVADGQVILPAGAHDRRGVQPTIALTADGKARAAVRVGQPVKFAATVDVPAGTGAVVEAAWDFDGKGTYPEKAALPAKPAGKLTLTTTHSFARPGTWFVTLKVASERRGNTASPYARVRNLARVRVVVE
ncbi:hypothetical protein [Novosphingobium sp.]|uniref:PKD domain-containing protein n=1 Tax=Novosphingobium sp. TaxID=1874826 RepID=UPI0025E97AC5|nr:hypothetical protein [Novosphingobium sp.]